MLQREETQANSLCYKETTWGLLVISPNHGCTGLDAFALPQTFIRYTRVAVL